MFNEYLDKSGTDAIIAKINSKTSNVGTITGITMNGSSKGTSGVVDLGTVLTAHQSLDGYVNAATYDSTAKKIYLKHDKSTVAEVDATAFIKDGMVSSVVVAIPSSGVNARTTCLIISFNTDAGQEDIEIPISQIFNASNYYTKTQIDNAGYITDIKTINGNSIEGTGNLTINGLPSVTASDNGKILVVSNGEWTLTSPVTMYSGTGTPNNSQGNNGDLYLQI